MKNRRLPVIAGVAVILALGLGGCGAAEDAASTSGRPTTSHQPGAGTESRESGMDDEALLEIQDRLLAELGEAFVQGWIEDGVLHVATTDPNGVPAIEAAGAVPHVVDYSAQQLREGIARIMRWQSAQPDPIRTAIHGYQIDGRSGGLILRVDRGHLDEVRTQLQQAKPAGGIPLQFTPSSGFATPAAG